MGSRLFILLIFSVSLLIGVPVWWMTTNVYRSTIPDISLQESQVIDDIPVRLSLHIIHPDEVVPTQTQLQTLHAALHESAVSTAKKFHKTSHISINKIFVSAKPTKIPDLKPQAMDEWIGKQLAASSLGTQRNGHYSLVVILNPSVTKPSAVIGSHRHAWITVSKFEDAQALLPVLTAQLRHMLFTPIKADDMRKRSYRFTFSLLNEDPASTVCSWNFSALEKRYLSELVSTFSRVHHIEVESQIVHYTQLKYEPSFDESTKEHYFIPAALPRFVDGTEWKVDSGSNAKELSLHFAAFVPSSSHSPLVIRHGPHSASTGFIIPHWGGFAILNLPVGEERPKTVSLDESTFLPLLQVFVSQLRQLMGLPVFKASLSSPSPLVDHIDVLSATRRGASDFEIDALSRQSIWSMLSETQHTLTQFTLMVDQIQNIPIHDHIHNTLARALTYRANALTFLTGEFDPDAAHTSISAALVAAEDVFFDKDMVGMLYFPSGHQLAIYLPLFLPLSFPILAGFRAELARRRQKRQERQVS